MAVTASESTFEQAAIERLQQLGYRYQHGAVHYRPLQSVVRFCLNRLLHPTPTVAPLDLMDCRSSSR